MEDMRKLVGIHGGKKVDYETFGWAHDHGRT